MFANFYPTGNYNDGEMIFFHPLSLWNRILLGSASATALTNTKSIQNDIGNLLKNFAADANDTFVPCLL